MALLAQPAAAVDFNWNVDGPADWNVGTNWDPEGPPSGGGGNHAFVNNGGTAEIAEDIPDIQDIFVGAGAETSGTLNQTGGSTFQGTDGWMFVGQDGGTGTYNLSGGTANKARLYIGRFEDSTGTLNLSGTGAVDGELFVAGVEGGSATVNVSETGSINTVLDAEGGSGNVEFHNATVTITGDATVNADNEVWVGQGGGNSTTLNQDSGTVEAETWIAIGRDSSTGVTNLSGDAVMRKINTGEGNSTGSFIVVGGVGDGGSGTLNIADNAVVESDTGMVLNEVVGQAGFVNQSGGTVTLNDYTPFDFQANYGASLMLGALNNDGVATSNGVAEYHLSGGTLNAETIQIVEGLEQTPVFEMTGGTLNATGFEGDLTQGGGTLSPGASPGTMTITGDYSLDSGDLFMEIEGATAGTEYDQLIVTGDVSLAGDLTLDGAFVPSLGDAFTLIDNQGANAISGTFTGLAEGTTVAFNGVPLSASYLGGDGNDFVLTAVPEPAALGLLTLGALGWVVRRRRR